MNSYLILGKTWFSSRKGWSLHSAVIYVNGMFIEKRIGTGVNDQWKQTAHEILQDYGFFPKTGKRLVSGMDKDYYDFIQATIDTPSSFVFDHVRVYRKGDL